MRAIVLCAVLVCARAGSGTPSRVVLTQQGPVRGYRDPHYDVYTFHSIPYATAPTGRDRFKAPLPPPVWQEPLEAVNKDIICPQFIRPNYLKKQNALEDCLIANVYVPDTNVVNLPVAVYVHSGGYAMGFGDMVNPRPLVNTQKVIIVTFNYRLAGHGFLCLGTTNIPGNAGSKDQVALLRWVRKNIASFGGNPDDVTLIGSSAGSSAVDLLMLSKMSRGLFNKIVAESGGNLAAFSTQPDPIQTAKLYAKAIGSDKNFDSVFELEEFFTSVSVEKLNSIFTTNTTDDTSVVGPCIERDMGQERFLEDSPVSIIKSRDYPKVPMLYGFTNMDGLLRVEFIGFEPKEDMKLMKKNFADYLPADLEFRNEDERNKVANDIKKFYFGNEMDEYDVLDYINYFTDIMIAGPMLRAVNIHLNNSHHEIYLYEYSFTDVNTKPVPYTKVLGASHCTQTIAVWGSDPIYNVEETSDEFEKMQKIMRTIWLNFIIHGKPIPEGSGLPEWPPVFRKCSPHMSLGKAIELRGSPLKERARFWEEIYAKYYKTPKSPPAPQTIRLY